LYWKGWITMAHEQLVEVVQRWTAVELQADAGSLDTLLADNFIGIGPRGFVLTREQWIARYRESDLRNEAFALHEMAVREYGNTAMVVAIQDQRSSFQGHDASGRFRITLILVRQDDRWQIAGWQASGPIPELPPRRD
jgi:ketosteroid isomerase-like protein